jgi:predicted nucleotidyltransferase
MDIKKAIINTLSYRALFKYPLNVYQLRTLLIAEEEISDEEFSQELAKLQKKGTIKSRNDRYYAPGFRPVDAKSRAKISRSLLEQNSAVFALLGQIPWVRMVAVTGSVAAYNADQKSDIDVFIISAPNRVWLTRFMTVLLLKLLGRYRTDGNEAGKICPNLYVDEDHMHWPKNKQNIYIAQEIVMMRPVVSKNNAYFRFINANKWIFKYNANFKIDLSLKNSPKKKIAQSGTVNAIERTLMQLQKAYMKSRQTKELTSTGLIHFNRDDWSETILKKCESFLEQKTAL